MASGQPTGLCIWFFYTNPPKCPKSDSDGPYFQLLHVSLLRLVRVFFFLLVLFLKLNDTPMLLQHHLHPLLRLLSISFPTQLADQRRTPATEASAQVSRPGNPGPADKNALILYGPTFAKSGWVRAARGNSCLGSHQKKERDFFDYRPFVHPPLRLAYSLGLHSRGAASQCKGTLCALQISLNSCLCFKGNNSLVL